MASDFGTITIDLRNLEPVRRLAELAVNVVQEAEGEYVGSNLGKAIEELQEHLTSMTAEDGA